MRRSVMILTETILVSMWLVAVPVQAASAFADTAFQQTWRAGEAAAPNFWGPLLTAHDGQQEAYKQAPNGQRLVQYFDKTRMELTIPALATVTTGLLTVELKTGKMQVGDAAFEQHDPAKVGLVGDSGSASPTYADLALLPEKDGRAFPEPPPYFYSNGRLLQAQNLPARANNIPHGSLYHKLDDPSGTYSQYVFSPFWDFIQSLPLPLSQTTGYAISPLIWVHATVGSRPTEVLVQAFERRVLTWNESNLSGKEVEFGNIGQHYYTWRYGSNPSPQAATPPTNISADFTPFVKRWGAHGVAFTFNADGTAHADWRTYIACNAKNPENVPCEDPYTSYAGHATMQFVSVSGDEATGNVLTSNDPRFQPANVVVKLVLKPYDMIELREPTGQSYTFCGSDYAKLVPREVRDTYPCGA